jgi:hypothetical protein
MRSTWAEKEVGEVEAERGQWLLRFGGLSVLHWVKILHNQAEIKVSQSVTSGYSTTPTNTLPHLT